MHGFGPAGNPLVGNEHYVQVEKSILINTVEQILSFTFLVLMLTTQLNAGEMYIIPVYSCVCNWTCSIYDWLQY